MMIPAEYRGKFFFHFTHLENLDQIIEEGLLSPKLKEEKGISHKNIAINEIQLRRSRMSVTVAPHGVIHDYVPFYFSARTPMMFSVLNTKNVDQHFLIHIAVSIDKLLRPDFIFTDSSANRNITPRFYSNPADLKKLDWGLIQNKAWKVSPYDKPRKMAEVLCHEKLRVRDIDYIVVWNDDIKRIVERKFKEKGVKCPPLKLDGENGYWHFVTWFGGDGEDGCSRVTGPDEMRHTLEEKYDEILSKRELLDIEECEHPTLRDIVAEMETGFENMREIEAIVGLETNNPRHRENVDQHTVTVVEQLKKLRGFKRLEDRNKDILLFCAYMHDVGKGPASRWVSGIQKPDDTHSRRSLESVARLMMNDIADLSDEEIYTVLFLVAYHDLTGDCLTRRRTVDCIKGLELNEERLKLLNLLNFADAKALASCIDMYKWREIREMIVGLLDD